MFHGIRYMCRFRFVDCCPPAHTPADRSTCHPVHSNSRAVMLLDLRQDYLGQNYSRGSYDKLYKVLRDRVLSSRLFWTLDLDASGCTDR